MPRKRFKLDATYDPNSPRGYSIAFIEAQDASPTQNFMLAASVLFAPIGAIDAEQEDFDRMVRYARTTFEQWLSIAISQRVDSTSQKNSQRRSEIPVVLDNTNRNEYMEEEAL